jgi:hypothetical protein
MMTLIVGRALSFGCIDSPRQLHVGSAKALRGPQQYTAYARRLSTVRRAGGTGFVLACCASCTVLATLVAGVASIEPVCRSKGLAKHRRTLGALLESATGTGRYSGGY